MSLATPSKQGYQQFENTALKDRALFIDCKQRLGPVRLNELTEAAVEWLSEFCGGDREAFSDTLLRDKVDELVFDEIFGPERRRPYEHLFSYLHRVDTWTSLCCHKPTGVATHHGRLVT
jgi:hypothetical protein